MRETQLELFHLGPPEQLPLLPYENPLPGRFPSEFFSGIPTVPGVYRMRGERAELLYVGKAKNLRTRVRSYARAAPENASPKVLRLLQKIRTIEWETAADEKSALLRENALLRTHRPPFNVANNASHTYAFFHLSDESADEVRLHFGLVVDPAYPDVYGAFKGIGRALAAYRALLRLLSLSTLDEPNAAALPAILLNRRRLPTFAIPHPRDASPLERRLFYRRLRQFFNGTGATLLATFKKLGARKSLDTFTRALVELDLETLTEFHATHAKRNYRVKRETAFAERLIPQSRLDDLFVLASRIGT